MNKNIEKYLIWACVFQGIEIIVQYTFPLLINYLVAQMKLEPGAYMFTTWAYILSSIPLRIVCGLWLRSEADRLRVNHRIWFWAGCLFEILGILLFYAYMILWKKLAVQPAKSVDG